MIDWHRPDYVALFNARLERLARIRQDPLVLPALKVYYRHNPWQMIEDWGCTVDPRNVERGLPAVMPFVLFPKQRELCEWIIDRWKGREPGLVEKSRDVGASWLVVALSCVLCLTHDDMVIGFGSRKEEYVDKIGSPKALFPKARTFMQHLPYELRGGWDAATCAPHMRITFPSTRAIMTGEAGDNIGRGDRTGIYFVDEAAYLERPDLVEASLSATTNCRIDVSSANGMANPFAQKRHGGKIKTFTLHWRDDPRKDETWYAKQQNDLPPTVVAQEIDIDYTASAEGLLIPSAWIQASVDAHVKLNIKPTGALAASLDVADEGDDKLAWCAAHGVVVTELVEWSGKGGDLYLSVERAFGLCDQYGVPAMTYDADGLGAGVRGDARKINEERERAGRKAIQLDAFRGSAAVYKPEAEDVKGRKNEDMFLNAKAQSWWALRTRFYQTYRAVVEGATVDPDEIISISSGLKLRPQLLMELSQPTIGMNVAGKMQIDKTPDGAKSPNLADALMIRFSRGRKPMIIAGAAVRRFAMPTAPSLLARQAQAGAKGVSAAAITRFRAPAR